MARSLRKPLSYEIVSTPIAGLKILLNKVVGDSRGYFCDLAEADNPMFKKKVRHIHGSLAVSMGVARAAHYHYRLHETLYTLSGTALWIFHDFKKTSKTFGATYALLAGFSKKGIITKGAPSYFIDRGSFAQFSIAPYVYHAFWPLTPERTVVVAVGEAGYDPTDYARPKLEEMPAAARILKKYGIKI
jgi:dTDP-4-dehydrorhamnose 3,5-epimerase-like enzyme